MSEDSAVIGKTIRELNDVAQENDVLILGLVRRGKRLPGFARADVIRKGDILVLEAGPDSIEAFVGSVDVI